MFVHRERLVEPIHPINGSHLIPSIETPVKNLYLANTGQIYPALTNGESVTRHARQAADTIVHNLRRGDQSVSAVAVSAPHATRQTAAAAEGSSRS
jgi:hypothetical protein